MHAITKNLRKLKGDMTLRAFANKLGVGQSTLHNYLKGRIPPATFIENVCKKLGCDANVLLGIKVGESRNASSKYLRLSSYLKADIVEKQKLLKEMKEL